MMTPVYLLSWVGSLLGLVGVLAAVAFVIVVGRGRGRWFAAAGLALFVLKAIVGYAVSPLLSSPAGGDPWGGYAAYTVVSLALTLLSWALVAAGVILLSRERLRTRAAAGVGNPLPAGWGESRPGYAAAPGATAVRPPADLSRHPQTGATEAPRPPS